MHDVRRRCTALPSRGDRKTLSLPGALLFPKSSVRFRSAHLRSTAMGKSTEKLWAAIIKDVQHMVQHPGRAEWSGAFAAVPAQVLNHISRLDQQPPAPRATWKKLVADLKVGCAASTAHLKAWPCRAKCQGWPALCHAVVLRMQPLVAISCNDCMLGVCNAQG